MSKAEYAAVRYMLGKLTVLLSAVVILNALMCGFVNYLVRPENIPVAFLLQYCEGITAAYASFIVMSNYYVLGGVLRVIPIKRERAAELCLAVCCIISAIPYITEMIFAFILAVWGKMSVGDALAAVSASLFAMTVTFYTVTIYFPRYSPLTASADKSASYTFAELIAVCTVASGLDGIIIRSHLSSGKPFGTASALPAVIAAAMMLLYPRYAKKSVQKALKHGEAYC